MKVKADVTYYLMDRNWIPHYGGLRGVVMDEAQRSQHSLHPVPDTIYRDLKMTHRRPSVKAELTTYVGKWLTCSKVQMEYQKPSRLFQQPKIPMWKWRKSPMDLITKLPRTASGCDTYQTLGTRFGYENRYHPQTDGQSERTIQRLENALQACVNDSDNSWETRLPLELVHETTKKIVQIRKRMATAWDRQKSYVDKRRETLGFQVGDRVLLKVSPWKGIIQFGKQGKLNPPYITPFENTKRIDPEIRVDEQPHFIEESIGVMERKVRKLKLSHIPIDKVRWISRREPKFFMEIIGPNEGKYIHLFTN
ncbi:hypothetical protein E3N88_08250 [Mikania micrantha]|uniref:Reverse transcriptase domain-containing protein n=1 Tax=Mikania micrantha TaxID=192012 RepID=A0A5N6PIS7_9ASTR|nr:hypothetical protein E3N88_08250 [Mikania micrantha]